MPHRLKLLAMAVLATGLVACQASYQPRVVPTSTSIDGFWFDPNGIQSRFSAGTFETRSTDTNTLLATGTYVQLNPQLVQIDVRSLVRNSNSRVNCALVSPMQLNCTSNTGEQFVLRRRAG